MSRPERIGPLAPFFARGRPLIADGGLATALEARGHRLDTRLWSAELLVSNPDAIRRTHAEYLAAGADCISTASYQASFPGFRAQGYGDGDAAGFLELSVALAIEARDEFRAEQAGRTGRLRPLVAASAGPYGAYLADGSEYDGRYGVEPRVLDEFHRRRFRLFARSDADLILCETIPSGLEVEVVLGILAETPEAWAWVSFCCADGARLWDGTPVEAVARLCDRAERVAAVGVNCVAPAHVGELIGRIRGETDLPVIVYPNSGEVYDAPHRGVALARERRPGGRRADPRSARLDCARGGRRRRVLPRRSRRDPRAAAAGRRGDAGADRRLARWRARRSRAAAVMRHHPPRPVYRGS